MVTCQGLKIVICFIGYAMLVENMQYVGFFYYNQLSD